ncbi:hypothetical protein ES288_A11G388900v1 [Gossypium darwinii]|uniref:Uncharacterized protein n=1 Tax=Gossypium darwinii TaxID=34276 RepID=A0A5D2EV84_GOSDA|nr:hypothetical protein ES288_A11G388900v1 [Gossypium darwinii]
MEIKEREEIVLKKKKKEGGDPKIVSHADFSRNQIEKNTPKVDLRFYSLYFHFSFSCFFNVSFIFYTNLIKQRYKKNANKMKEEGFSLDPAPSPRRRSPPLRSAWLSQKGGIDCILKKNVCK